MWRRIKRVNVVYLKPESILVKYSFNIWQIKNNKEHYNDILEDCSRDPNQKFSSISCIVCLFWFYVVLLSVGNISIIRRCHQTANLGLCSAGRDLYPAIPAETRGLGFCSLNPRAYIHWPALFKKQGILRSYSNPDISGTCCRLFIQEKLFAGGPDPSFTWKTPFSKNKKKQNRICLLLMTFVWRKIWIIMHVHCTRIFGKFIFIN